MVERAPLPLRLLVIDDDADLRQFLQDLLAEEGYVVDASGSLDDALAMIEAHVYHLILTDLLTHSSAEPLRSALTVRQHAQPTPVMALTGWTVTPAEVTRAGLARLIPKPFDLSDLLAAVASVRPEATLTPEQQRQAADVARLLDAYNVGDFEASLALCADDVRMRYDADDPLADRGLCDCGIACVRERLAYGRRLNPDTRILEYACFPMAKGIAIRCVKSWSTPDAPGGYITLPVTLNIQFSGDRIREISLTGNSQRWRALIPESAFLPGAQPRPS